MDAFVQELESSPWKAFWPAGSGGGRGRGGREKKPPGCLASSLRLDGVRIQERLDEELGGLVQAGKVG